LELIEEEPELEVNPYPFCNYIKKYLWKGICIESNSVFDI